MPDFIGRDPESNSVECPAVFVFPETGDFHFRGKTVTDPTVIAAMNEHVGKAEDESDVWLPARMAPFIREALEGYERGRVGPGQHSFWEILDHTHTSLIRFEMRDSYDETEQGFAEWKATGDIGAYDWGEHLDRMRAATARGVTIRRVRVVSEPVTDYIRWEHTCTRLNVEAGEDIRWLPRTKAADLLLPGADCWVFDHRVVRWNFQRGDGTNPRHYTFSSDPRTIRDIVAAFEMAWDRATPHEEYKADQKAADAALWDQILGPMAFAEPLTDDEIERRLSKLDGWTRKGDQIPKTFEHTCHPCVHLAMYVAAKAREVGHHPDIDIRWQRIRFGTTTHDAGHRITDLDFAMARHIDAIAAGHEAKPVPTGDA